MEFRGDGVMEDYNGNIIYIFDNKIDLKQNVDLLNN